MSRRSIQTLIAFATCMAVSGVLRADSFLVNNLNNSGAGTLRAAIVSANANPGADTIGFNASWRASFCFETINKNNGAQIVFQSLKTIS